MWNKLNRSLAIAIVGGIAASGAWCQAQEETGDENLQGMTSVSAEEAEGDEQDDGGKLVRLGSLEQAFIKNVRRRKLLALKNNRLQDKLKEAEESEKKDIKKQMKQVQKNLKVLNDAMNVIFAPSQPRQYEYNPVESTVYVKVGNLEQAFGRAIQARDALLQRVQDKQEKLENAEKKKKKEIQSEVDDLKQQYQTVAAALQVVFNVVPERDYEYNPKNSTLYLQVSDKEAKKIRAKIKEQRKKRQNASEGEETGNE